MNIDLLVIFLMNAFIIIMAIIFGIFIYPKRELSEETKRRPRSFVSNAFFREFWYFLMGPLKRQFLKHNVSPNTLTWFGFIFSALSGVAFGLGHFGVGGWFVILAATCDIYDGQLARAKGINNKSGAFLDSVLDRLGESFMFCGLAWYFREDMLWFLVLFVTFTGSQLISYTRARAEGLGFGGARGFFQRAERMIVLSFGTCLAPVFDYFYGAGIQTIYLTLACMCIGSVHTSITRSVSIYLEIRSTEK